MLLGGGSSGVGDSRQWCPGRLPSRCTYALPPALPDPLPPLPTPHTQQMVAMSGLLLLRNGDHVLGDHPRVIEWLHWATWVFWLALWVATGARGRRGRGASPACRSCCSSAGMPLFDRLQWWKPPGLQADPPHRRTLTHPLAPTRSAGAVEPGQLHGGRVVSWAGVWRVCGELPLPRRLCGLLRNCSMAASR